MAIFPHAERLPTSATLVSDKNYFVEHITILPRWLKPISLKKKLKPKRMWSSIIIFSFQCPAFLHVPLFMCQVNHFPLTLSNGGRNLQIRRRNGENTKHDFREVRPAQIRPPHSLRQFHQILTDRLIISKLYLFCSCEVISLGHKCPFYSAEALVGKARTKVGTVNWVLFGFGHFLFDIDIVIGSTGILVGNTRTILCQVS